MVDNEFIVFTGFLDKLITNFSPLQKKQVLTYSQMIFKWGKVFNLTAKLKANLLVQHFIDGLLLAKFINQQTTNPLPKKFEVADIGSGAGFTLICCAILNPKISFSSYEIDINKSAFLRQVILDCKINNIKLLSDFNNAPKNAYDILTSKAFLTIENFLAKLPNLINPTGFGLILINPQHLDILQNVSSNIYKNMLISPFLCSPEKVGEFVDIKGRKNVENSSYSCSFLKVF